jgi:hypothetical protein
MNMLTLSEEVARVTPIVVLSDGNCATICTLFLKSGIFPASFQFEVGLQGEHGGEVLLEVVIATDL